MGTVVAQVCGPAPTCPPAVSPSSFLRWAECLRELSCLFKGCWRISTSRRMQTNYASSPGRAEPLLWTSVKPFRQWWSWEDWRCRFFWRRAAGNCMWEPGCTEHCSAGSGWTLSLNEQGPKRAATARHTKDTERWCHFSCIRSTPSVFWMQSSIWSEAQTFIPHVYLAQDLKPKGETEIWRNFFSFQCYLLPCANWNLKL